MKHTTLTLALAGTCLFGLSASAALTLVSAWDLNEGDPATTTDSSASTSSADFSTATGLDWGAASTAPGSTASLTFTGANAVNTLNTNVSTTALNGTGAKTFVAWINPTAGNGSILSYSPSHGNDAGQDLRLLIDASGFLRAEVNSGFLLSNAQDFRNDGWNMVAVIFDGNTNTSSFYVGGTGMVTPSSAADRAINTSNSADGDPNTTVNFVIGGDQATRSFTGGLDMVSAWNGAATLAELDSLYATGVVPEPGTYALMLGLAGLGVVLWRRRRA
jgi:hypothetical protein